MIISQSCTDTTVGENNLSFIETSALDASNVELAFQNILTGKFTNSLLVALAGINFVFPEIYRIVSSKALDNGDAAQAPSGGVKIDMTPSGTPDAKGGKCC